MTSRPNCQIEVVPERLEYRLGERVNASIAIQAKEDLHIREGFAELVCQGYYAIPAIVEEGGRPSFVLHTQDRRTLLRRTHFPIGWQENYTVGFSIPPEAPPTYKGRYIYIHWWIRTKLDVSAARDVLEETLIAVRLDPAKFGVIEVESARTDSDCDLEFHLERDWVAEGQFLQGDLVITPRRDAEVTSIWVEFNRVEEIFARLGGRAVDLRSEHKIEFAQHRKLLRGLTESFRFQLRISENEQPFVSTDVGRAYGELRGVVAIGRKECFVSRPVLITTA